TYLDVATGTGDVLLASLKRHPEYQRFIGVDISSQMLKLAQQKANANPSYHSADVSFRQQSAEHMEFTDASVDCLTIAFGLRNVVDKGKALGEFQRVLKK